MQFIDEIKADVVYFKYTKFSAWSSTDRKGENGKMINASNTNLFNRYSNLACNSYYGIPIEPENLFEQGHEQDHCEAFIRTHFEKGCKSEALNFEETWEKHYRTEGKHIHTVSLYILGLYVQEIVRDELPGMKWIIRGSHMGIREIKDRLNIAFALYESLKKKFGEQIEFEKCAIVAYLTTEFEKAFHATDDHAFQNLVNAYLRNDLSDAKIDEILPDTDSDYKKEVQELIAAKKIDNNYRIP